MKALFTLLLCNVFSAEESCSDYPVAYECMDFCLSERAECQENCDTSLYRNNTECNFNCELDAVTCYSHCPCFEHCENGCSDCPSPFCTCIDPDSNSDFINCERIFNLQYSSCILQCPNGDMVCLGGCGREYDTNVDTCPCREGCPNGCPCPNFDCSDVPSTTTSTTRVTTTTIGTTQTTPVSERNTILLLNTKSPSNIPLMFNSTGFVERNFLFLFDEHTSVYESCGLTFRNEFYIFGGEGFGQTRQLSKIVGCQLKRIGSLTFDHQYGSCTNMADYRVYLCFQNFANDHRRCRQALSPEGFFQQTAVSNFEHKFIQISASNQSVLAVGSNNHRLVELYTSDAWENLGNYPFSSSYIYQFATIYHEGGFYIFSGNTGSSSHKQIYRLDEATREWKFVGSPRYNHIGHAVIFDGTDFIITGKSYREKCSLDRDGDMTCSYINDNLSLGQYETYPELFLVDSHFGKDLNKCY